MVVESPLLVVSNSLVKVARLVLNSRLFISATPCSEFCPSLPVTLAFLYPHMSFIQDVHVHLRNLYRAPPFPAPLHSRRRPKCNSNPGNPSQNPPGSLLLS